VDFYGTLQRISKINGGYHVQGPVGIVDDKTFTNIVENVIPLIKLGNDSLKIVVPPLPRYLLTPCCQDPSHCTNMSEDRYREKALSKIEHLRGVLKNALNRAGVQNFWVLNTVDALKGSASEGENITEKIESIRPALGTDGVHLTATGYSRLYKGILAGVENLRSRIRGTGSRAKNAGFYWRGILSPIGSSERTSGMDTRARLVEKDGPRPNNGRRRPHPYNRK